MTGGWNPASLHTLSIFARVTALAIWVQFQVSRKSTPWIAAGQRRQVTDDRRFDVNPVAGHAVLGLYPNAVSFMELRDTRPRAVFSARDVWDCALVGCSGSWGAIRTHAWSLCLARRR